MFINLFKRNLECFHDNVAPDLEAGYCPDCGKYIENQWFMTRCSCCGIKQKTIFTKETISKAIKYCKNCGCSSFTVEKLSKINFVDIHYAVLIKQVSEDYHNPFTQSWVEPPLTGQVKFLTDSIM